MTEAAKRGGARKGAGRTETPADLYRRVCTVRLPAWLLEWLREQPQSAGELVEQALCKAHKLKAPKA
jgi:hypothetical protein